MKERSRLNARILTSATERDCVIPGGVVMAQMYSDLFDEFIGWLYDSACTNVGVNGATLPLAVVATGGYGRRQVSPCSDIDITFVPLRHGDPRTDKVIRRMFSDLMQISGSRSQLKVGYSYRLLTDCVALDVPTASALLDARLVVGSERVFIQFEEAFWSGFNSTEFIFAKIAEREAALVKIGASPRVVEPNLKEGPGGLRDIQTMVWLVQASGHVASGQVRGRKAFQILIKHLDLDRTEAGNLEESLENLLQVRNVLHVLANRQLDQLVVTRQEEVALALGFGAREHNPAAVQELMNRLYPILNRIRTIAQQVMDQVGNSRLMLSVGLDCHYGRIVPANSALETEDPMWLLWAFELAQRYRLKLSAAIERTALELVAQNPIPGDLIAAGQIFTQILVRVQGSYISLQKMADLGILGWFMPEFGVLMDLVTNDSSHNYTVGQHTLFVIRNLEQLLYDTGEYRNRTDSLDQSGASYAGTQHVGEREATSEQREEMRQLLQELTCPECLLLAALLHDCGKVELGRPHAESGAEVAKQVCQRLGWTEEATATVCFLVRHHLLMAETSRLRDLGINETIADFTDIVKDTDLLNRLYLLTYADTKAVGAGVYTPMMAGFLRELWLRAGARLVQTYQQQRIAEEVGAVEENTADRARRRLLKSSSLQNLPQGEVMEHFASMPTEYLLNQPPDRIAMHIEFIRSVRIGQPVIDYSDLPGATYTEITVCCNDANEPGLLARIANILYTHGLSVHGAQVTTRINPNEPDKPGLQAEHIALDMIWVDFRGRQLSTSKRKAVTGALSTLLSDIRTNNDFDPDLLKAKVWSDDCRRDSHIEIVSVQKDTSKFYTLIETRCSNPQSALYYSALALAHLGWNIRSARVSPWQGGARAVFYVIGIRELSEKEVIARLKHALDMIMKAIL